MQIVRSLGDFISHLVIVLVKQQLGYSCFCEKLLHPAIGACGSSLRQRSNWRLPSRSRLPLIKELQ